MIALWLLLFLCLCGIFNGVVTEHGRSQPHVCSPMCGGDRICPRFPKGC